VKTEQCPDCEGSGAYIILEEGGYSEEAECPNCKGTGEVQKKKKKKC
jgi:DnaJ-class molecular chaperone